MTVPVAVMQEPCCRRGRFGPSCQVMRHQCRLANPELWYRQRSAMPDGTSTAIWDIAPATTVRDLSQHCSQSQGMRADARTTHATQVGAMAIGGRAAGLFQVGDAPRGASGALYLDAAAPGSCMQTPMHPSTIQPSSTIICIER